MLQLTVFLFVFFLFFFFLLYYTMYFIAQARVLVIFTFITTDG